MVSKAPQLPSSSSPSAKGRCPIPCQNARRTLLGARVLAGDVKLEELEELEELSPTPARNGSGLHIAAAAVPIAHVDDE
jgi:hypothetical protein